MHFSVSVIQANLYSVKDNPSSPNRSQTYDHPGTRSSDAPPISYCITVAQW